MENRRKINGDGNLPNEGVLISLVNESPDAIQKYLVVPDPKAPNTLKEASLQVELRIGDRRTLVNGRPVDIDTEPFITDRNRTMVPLRFITEAFGCGVEWRPEGREVSITRAVTTERETDATRTETETSFTREVGSR